MPIQPRFAYTPKEDYTGPQLVVLRVVPTYRNWPPRRWGTTLTADCHVVSDGLNCFVQLAAHPRIVHRGGRAAAQESRLCWVNTLLCNLKTAMSGTYHAFKFKKHGKRYQAEYAYRFNRRFDMPAMVPRLLCACAATQPQPERLLRVARSWG